MSVYSVLVLMESAFCSFKFERLEKTSQHFFHAVNQDIYFKNLVPNRE